MILMDVQVGEPPGFLRPYSLLCVIGKRDAHGFCILLRVFCSAQITPMSPMVVESPPTVHYSDNASTFCDLLIAPVVNNRFLFQELQRFVHFRFIFFTHVTQTFRHPASVGTAFPFGSHSVPPLHLSGILCKRRLHT